MRRFLHLLVTAVTLLGPASAEAALPTEQPYQSILRSHLATYTESDFTIARAPLTYDATSLTTDDEIYRTWILFENLGRELPDPTGLKVSPSLFTLSAIEAGGAVNMRVGRNSGFFDPAHLAWWAEWSYPGNPYRPGTANSTAAKKRAFVAAAVDLMMLDYHHEHGGAWDVRSDYMGGSLIWQAYTYYVVKSMLPAAVQTAYETGLRRIFARIEAVAPVGSGGADMETFQLVGLWYAAEACDDDGLRARALARARSVLDEIIMPAGYEHHGGAHDASYSGIALRFLTWAALLYRDAEIDRRHADLSRLKAHLTLPEPDGRFFGPTHFSIATGWDSPNDQWWSVYRDAAAAMVSDEAKYLVTTGRKLETWYRPYGLETAATMTTEIQELIGRANTRYDFATLDARTPGTWNRQHWHEPLNYAQLLYVPGFFAEMNALAAASSPLMKPPFANAAFVRTFADDFFTAKVDAGVGTYGVIIHGDRVLGSWAGDLAGLSGGALGAFWTPQTGSVLLGRTAGTQNADADTWTGTHPWNTWATHAISGLSQAGKPFSSARNLFPTATFAPAAPTPSATISGRIGPHDGGHSAPGGAITGTVSYARVFKLFSGGLEIESTLRSDGTDIVAELWEMLPVLLRGGGQTADGVLELRAGGGWEAPATTLRTGVDALRVTRHGASVYVLFETPQRVRLSPAAWESSGTRVQTVMIDLLGAGAPKAMPASATVRYAVCTVADLAVCRDPLNNPPLPDAGTSVLDAGTRPDAAAPEIDAAVPAVDAAAPTVDATAPEIDAAAPAVDATAPEIDAAVPAVDATAPPEIDAAVPAVDATTPPADATVTIDGGPSTIDGGPLHVDGGLLDAGGEAPRLEIDGGCACRTGPRRAPGADAPGLALLLALLLLRRGAAIRRAGCGLVLRR